MTADTRRWAAIRPALLVNVHSDSALLRTLAVSAGMGWSILFVAVGLGFGLQLYGDGAIFSYAVAVEDAWAFHWHNIAGRLFVYLYAVMPAETYVALTADARGGIRIYAGLFFSAQLLGLAATFAADPSKGRIVFGYACASTACLCPLVFGFPTEMWIAHAAFWPALAVCHSGRGGIAAAAALLLALVFSHEGGLILAIVILSTLLLRGWRDAAFLQVAGLLLAAVPVWLAVKWLYRPDVYIADVLARAGETFFDVEILTGELVLLMAAALAGYCLVFLLLWRLSPARAHICAAAIAAAALVVYWLWFDRALHGENRYYLRTVLLLATAALGALAAIHALNTDGRVRLSPPFLPRLVAIFTGEMAVRAVIGAAALVTFVHAVETAKFVTAWTHYKAAVRALAMGEASDPSVGDARFVSTARIGADLNRLSWSSTIPFLSVLVAPGFAPARLVVDPTANYFWLSCETARASEAAARALPRRSRALIRAHACLHRLPAITQA
jgi:hypothetical protein